MKNYLLAVSIFFILPACNQNHEVTHAVSELESPIPIQRGELISVDLLDKPYPEYSPSSLSWSTLKGGEVEIYENFILATSKEGVSHLALHNWYRGLKFKKISKKEEDGQPVY